MFSEEINKLALSLTETLQEYFKDAELYWAHSPLTLPENTVARYFIEKTKENPNRESLFFVHDINTIQRQIEHLKKIDENITVEHKPVGSSELEYIVSLNTEKITISFNRLYTGNPCQNYSLRVTYTHPHYGRQHFTLFKISEMPNNCGACIITSFISPLKRHHSKFGSRLLEFAEKIITHFNFSVVEVTGIKKQIDKFLSYKGYKNHLTFFNKNSGNIVGHYHKVLRENASRV